LANYSNNFEGLWSLADHKIRDFSLSNHRFAVGVSGGADSIALFHVFLSFFKQKKIFDLVVFHINFGLRGLESDGDEDFVRAICRQANIPCLAFHAHLTKGPGVQERAREFRRKIQANLIKDGHVIALAHNADDVAENIILRLARGVSLDNAAGMRVFNDQLFRPWLECPRSTIRQALRDEGLSWREDSSNESTVYARNRIRLEVIPTLESLFPGAAKRLALTFLHSAQCKIAPAQEAITSIPLSQLASVAQEALSAHMHEFLTRHYEGRSPVSRQVLEQIAKTIHRMSTGLDGEARTFELPGSKKLLVSRTEIRIQHCK
jgi:tRNA(Ile)-lysidine synthetase-like protein